MLWLINMQAEQGVAKNEQLDALVDETYQKDSYVR
jgi:hypothetical protein